MKPSNQIFAVVLALTFAQSARASVNPNAPMHVESYHAGNRLRSKKYGSLLERLREAQALDVDADGNVRIKPSVLQQLRAQGRLD